MTKKFVISVINLLDIEEKRKGTMIENTEKELGKYVSLLQKQTSSNPLFKFACAYSFLTTILLFGLPFLI